MAPPPPPPPPDDLVQDIAHPPFASTRSLGLGVLAVLPDELVTAFLTHCSAAELDRLSQCSRALFVFARDDLLWRNVCLCLNAELRFQGSWRMTFLAYWEAREVSSESDGTQTPPRGDRRLPPLDLASWDFRSHYLHDRWLRSCLDPAMLPLRPDGNRVPTLDPANPADVEQIKRHVRVGLPFVLSASATSSWEARTEWHPDALRSKYGSIQFRIGAGTENNTARSIRHVDMRLDSYLDYCARQNDESPLYLFDAEFGSRAPSMLKEYLPFDLFESDLMSALEPRPMDFRWLVVGPPRSGAGWHCDPLGTSAWNALLFGQKRWAVYPPDVPPPEVLDKRASLDWFLDVYPQLPPQSMPFEFLQNEGETVFVPAGWWHAILNVSPGVSVAVTQNFLERRNLPRFAFEAAARFPPDVFSRIKAQMEGKDGGLLGEAGKMFQPCSDSELQRLGHGVRASLHASFRSVSAWQRELDRIDGALNLAGGRNKWEAMGGTSPVFARNDVVVKLCPLLSEGNNSLAPIDSEVLARERILDADLVPPILSIGGYGNDKAEMAPWIAIARARGESLDSYRRRCARLGLQPTESNLASWLAQQTKSIHALPAIVDSSRMKDARGQREWRQLLARLWDGTLQKRLLRLPEADREPFAWLLKETSADKLLDALPENERARMLHADLHAGNVFGEAAGESWKPLQLIDFGDSFHAQNGEWFDVAWEFVPLFASILLRPEEVTDFMRTYGIHESREREVLRRVALYTLVWEFPGAVDSCVGRIEHGEPGGDPLLALFGEQIPL